MKEEAGIIAKIKKLLALGQDKAAAEQERESAMRMAFSLLAKHNLDMQDVLLHGKTVEDRINFENAAFGTVWARQISQSIAKLFFCKYYSGRKVTSCKVVHHFVGKVSNATTAGLLAEWIVASVTRECNKRFGGDTVPAARAFGVGVSDRIYARVEEMMKTVDVEFSTSTALVLRSLYVTELEANMGFLEDSGVNLRLGKKANKGVRADAYADGKEYGDKVNLNPQVGGEVVKRIG